MNVPVYRLTSLDGRLAGYYRGHITPGKVVGVEEIYLPDGSHSRPGDPVPRGIIFSKDYAEELTPEQIPDFIGQSDL